MSLVRKVLGDWSGCGAVWGRLLVAGMRIGLIAVLFSVIASGGPVQADDGAEPEEEAHQVPVEEAVELPDSPAADEASGNAEADLPAVEGPESEGAESDVAPPPVENPEGVEQPAIEE